MKNKIFLLLTTLLFSNSAIACSILNSSGSELPTIKESWGSYEFGLWCNGLYTGAQWTISGPGGVFQGGSSQLDLGVAYNNIPLNSTVNAIVYATVNAGLVNEATYSRTISILNNVKNTLGIYFSSIGASHVLNSGSNSVYYLNDGLQYSNTVTAITDGGVTENVTGTATWSFSSNSIGATILSPGTVSTAGITSNGFITLKAEKGGKSVEQQLVVRRIPDALQLVMNGVSYNENRTYSSEVLANLVDVNGGVINDVTNRVAFNVSPSNGYVNYLGDFITNNIITSASHVTSDILATFSTHNLKSTYYPDLLANGEVILTSGVHTVNINDNEQHLKYIEIIPLDPTPVGALNENSNVRYEAIGHFDTGQAERVHATWSENSNYTTLNAPQGEQVTLSVGQVTSPDHSVRLSASFTHLNKTDDFYFDYNILNSHRPFSHLEIAGLEADVIEGAMYSLSIAAIYDDLGEPGGGPANWWSVDSPYAYIDSEGELNVLQITKDEPIEITAGYTFEGSELVVSKTVKIKNTNKHVVDLQVNGNSELIEGQAASFSVTTIYDDGSSDSNVIAQWRVVSDFASVDSATGTLNTSLVDGDQLAVLFASFTKDGVTKTVSRELTIKDTDQAISLISRSATGNQGNADSYKADVSGNGSVVAFTSKADNLLPSTVQSSGIGNVYVNDRENNVVLLASVNTSGNGGNGNSTNASINRGGTSVVFESVATNLLVGGDTNGVSDIFHYDVQGHALTRVNQSDANGNSYAPDISADGRFVVYSSDATNLVNADANGVRDIFITDRDTAITELVSQDTRYFGDSELVGADGASNDPVISDDGRFVAFSSTASNLVYNDTNNALDVFVYDRYSKIIKRISLGKDLKQLTGSSKNPSISFDGRYVAFEYSSTPFSSTNDAIYVIDQVSGSNSLVDLTNYSGGAIVNPSNPEVSDNGRMITFVADESVDGLTTVSGVFVFDRFKGFIKRISTDQNGLAAMSGAPAIESLGKLIVFDSAASQLLPATVDTNNVSDVFSVANSYGAVSVVSLKRENLDALVGQLIEVDLYIDASNDSTLGGGLSISFDSEKLSYVGFEFSPASPEFVAGQDFNSLPQIAMHGNQLNILSFADFLKGVRGRNKHVGTFTFNVIGSGAVRLFLERDDVLDGFFSEQSTQRQSVHLQDLTLSLANDANSDGISDDWVDQYRGFVCVNGQKIDVKTDDCDGDGLTNEQEYLKTTLYGGRLNPVNPDSDLDGVNDLNDICPFESNASDFDNNGVCDSIDSDDDGDGIFDTDEIINGLNPYFSGDALLDVDGDGLVNIDEYNRGSDMSVKNSVYLYEKHNIINDGSNHFVVESIDVGPSGAVYIVGHINYQPIIRKYVNDQLETNDVLATGSGVATDVVVSNNGFIYVSGYSDSDGFIARYNENLGDKSYRSVSTDIGNNVVSSIEKINSIHASGNIISLVGAANNNYKTIYVSQVVFSDTGLTSIWEKKLEATNSLDHAIGNDITTGIDGTVYVVGELKGVLSIDGCDDHVSMVNVDLANNPKSRDILLVAFDSSNNGSCIWSKFFASGGEDSGETIELYKNESLYIGGSFSKDINFSGIIKSATNTSPDITGKGTDGFILKIDRATQQPLWAKQIGQFVSDIDLDSAGSILAVGRINTNNEVLEYESSSLPDDIHTKGFVDSFLLHLNLNGDYQGAYTSANTNLRDTLDAVAFSEEYFSTPNGDALLGQGRVIAAGDINVNSYPTNNKTHDFDPSSAAVSNGTSTYNDSVYISLLHKHDSDGDGYADSVDAFLFNYLEYLDSDLDGIGNNADPDDDNDQMPDFFEVQYGLNPVFNDANLDLDQDGISNFVEYLNGTNPKYGDTDGDGYEDDIDRFPTNPSEWADFDNDGVGDNADSDDDNDGMPDWFENKYNVANASVDNDGDGLTNLQEYLYGANPNLVDTDGDGVSDYQEAITDGTPPALHNDLIAPLLVIINSLLLN